MNSKKYLHATGSVCYDNTGVTFPTLVPIDMDALAKIFFGHSCGWENLNGYSTLPKVLVFYCNTKKEQLFENVMNAFYRGFIVKRAEW